MDDMDTSNDHLILKLFRLNKELRERIEVLEAIGVYEQTKLNDNRDKTNVCYQFLKTRQEFIDWHQVEHMIYESGKNDSGGDKKDGESEA